MSRGGARVRVAPQRNNSSQLLGVSFRWATKRGQSSAHPVICIAIGDRRTTRGVTKAGVREAMRAALKLRRDAGLRVPTLTQAIEAFEEWRRG